MAVLCADPDPAVRGKHPQRGHLGLLANHREEFGRCRLQPAERDGENQPVSLHARARQEGQSIQGDQKTLKWQIINPSIKLFINSTNFVFAELRGDAEEVRAGGVGLHASHLHAARRQEEDRQARVQSSSPIFF